MGFVTIVMNSCNPVRSVRRQPCSETEH